MLKGRKHNLDEVLRDLRKKKDVQITGIQIQVIKGKKADNDLGNKSWGKIDFLTKYCGYKLTYVSEFVK